MKILHIVAFILVVVGALNWGVYGLFGSDIVGLVFGGMTSAASKAVYVLVGLAGILLLVTHKRDCRACSAQSSGM